MNSIKKEVYSLINDSINYIRGLVYLNNDF